jgi:hypothetical protein
MAGGDGLGCAASHAASAGSPARRGLKLVIENASLKLRTSLMAL